MMHTYRILLYLLSAASTTITLGSCCYYGGHSFSDIHGRLVDEAIGDFCERYVPGNFIQGQKVSICYSFPPNNSGNRVEMEIINKSQGSQGTSKEECKEKLIHFHNACERGGEEERDGFFWRVDPQTGPC
ncbi:hypothetical protein DHEL01_v210519 [Diaporthe helianthi]|uniref:Glycan binding protein Y3-like domain-containing protein n=1 Tax=Diaporthe helianthi TaxID=158607 RepID=A0A2P5HLE0_DIAHE|nr:hypothetical protein DHEL01_v210519 [Diaporthe helianthi]